MCHRLVASQSWVFVEEVAVMMLLQLVVVGHNQGIVVLHETVRTMKGAGEGAQN
jgi:hypothetical protein